MSTFTAPFTFSNNTELRMDNYISNEEALKKWSNQGIEKSDISDASLSGYNIQPGKLDIIRNSYSFITSLIAAQVETDEVGNHSFLTSTTKNNSQTASIQYQDIAGSGVTFTMPQTGWVVFHYYVHAHTYDNEVVAGNDGPGNGRWNNQIVLRIYDKQGNAANKDNTESYTFEGAGAALDTKDPGYDLEAASYRSGMATFRVELTAGTYTACLTMNPHAETINCICKGMMVETFYL